MICLARIAASIIIISASLWAQPTVILPGIPPHQAMEKRVLGPGDALVPQIANGTLNGGAFFFTWFEAINVTNAPASFQVLFGDDEGNPLILPLYDGEFAGFGGNLAPGAGGGSITVPDNAPIRTGYALVIADPPGSVAVTTIFNNQVPGFQGFQAGIPPDIVAHSRFRTLFFGGIGDLVSSLAVVSVWDQTLTVNARNQITGSIMCSSQLFVPAAGHRAFIVRDMLPCTSNIQGVLEVIAPLGGTGAVAFMAADQGVGAFTTLPVYGDL